MDWQLSLFRFGLLACFCGALFIATQFDIAESTLAIWNHNPTTEEIAAADVAAVNAKKMCLAKKAKTTEYLASCYPDAPPFRGLPREKAAANVRNFLACGMPLLMAMLALVLLGRRMAREKTHLSR
jgi:hypothetical protein